MVDHLQHRREQLRMGDKERAQQVLAENPSDNLTLAPSEGCDGATPFVDLPETQ